MEKYPSGRRGSPAKGVVCESAARVQIPPSPPKKHRDFEVSRSRCFLFVAESLDFMELRALIVLVVARQSDSPPPIESTTVLGSSRLSSDLWIIVYSMDD